MISLPALPDNKLYRGFCPDHKGQSKEEILTVAMQVLHDWDKSDPVWVESNKTLYFRIADAPPYQETLL
jgi:hypothetical protein